MRAESQVVVVVLVSDFGTRIVTIPSVSQQSKLQLTPLFFRICQIPLWDLSRLTEIRLPGMRQVQVNIWRLSTRAHEPCRRRPIGLQRNTECCPVASERSLYQKPFNTTRPFPLPLPRLPPTPPPPPTPASKKNPKEDPNLSDICTAGEPVHLRSSAW